MVIELENRYATDAELAREIVDASVVLAPYQNHRGSSGVLLWAAAAGRPVITQDSGLMGWLVARHRLGEAVDTRDRTALAAAMSRSPGWSPEGASGFLRAHTPGAFARTVLDGMLCTAPGR